MPLRYGVEVANNYQPTVVLNVGTTAQIAQGSANQDALSNLKDRKYIYVYVEEGVVAWGLDSTMSQSNWQNKAVGVFDAGSQEVLPMGPNLTVYLVNVAASPKSRVHITELS